jgi:murein DD-endopeptidase MepM/ murein hydrolase activator NlpD
MPAAVLADEEGTPPSLALPIDCTVGRDCFVQYYVDRQPGPGARDFTCGHLARDGHKGIDIRLIDLAAMRRGVAVLAAAPGRVRERRDGMVDMSVRDLGADVIEGRDCGNGVVISHGGGWETQYCHMQSGSIAVRRGDVVQTGQVLGRVGLSGNTEFPHVHFQIRHGSAVVDPYVGEGAGEGCGTVGTPLWTAGASAALAYRPGGVLALGFTGVAPKLSEIEDGRHHNQRLAATAKALVFWSHAFGLRKGDIEILRVRDPEGRVVVEKEAPPFPRDKATYFRYVGRRLKAAAWPPGTYVGEYRLMREGEVVVRAVRKVEVR